MWKCGGTHQKKIHDIPNTLGNFWQQNMMQKTKKMTLDFSFKMCNKWGRTKYSLMLQLISTFNIFNYIPQTQYFYSFYMCINDFIILSKSWKLKRSIMRRKLVRYLYWRVSHAISSSFAFSACTKKYLH